MSVDAIVERVEYKNDGTVKLHLIPRDSRDGPAGQPSLTIVNPVPGLESLEGLPIWGGSGAVMFRETKLADRVGYTRIRLTEPT